MNSRRHSLDQGAEEAREKGTRKRRTQQERREETRGRLLDATIRLLGETGYSRFRITDAAQLAQVSRGGQTHHFATKNDLVEAAIEQVFDKAAESARVEAGRSYDGSVLDHAIAHLADFLHSSAYRVSVNMLISAGADAHLAERIRVISRRTRPPIERAWIERLIFSGVAPELAEDALWTAWSIQRGIVHDEIIGDASRSPRNLMAFAMNMIEQQVHADPASNPPDGQSGPNVES